MMFPLIAFSKPSFDCAKATTKVEKTICSDDKLAELDLELSKIYSEKKSIPNVKSSQKKWIKNRNKIGTNVDELKKIYQNRIEEFKESKVKCDAGKSGKHILNKTVFDKFVKTDKSVDNDYNIVFSCNGKKIGDFVVGIADKVLAYHFGRKTYYFEYVGKNHYKVYNYPSIKADLTHRILKDETENEWVLLEKSYMKRGHLQEFVFLFSPFLNKKITVLQTSYISGEEAYYEQCEYDDLGKVIKKDENLYYKNLKINNNQILFDYYRKDCNTEKLEVSKIKYSAVKQSFEKIITIKGNSNPSDKKSYISDVKKEFIVKIK